MRERLDILEAKKHFEGKKIKKVFYTSEDQRSAHNLTISFAHAMNELTILPTAGLVFLRSGENWVRFDFVERIDITPSVGGSEIVRVCCLDPTNKDSPRTWYTLCVFFEF